MLAVHAVLEKLVFWVHVVKDGICVGLVGRREYNHLERLARLLQALHEIGTQIDASADSLLTWEVNLENYIWILSLNIINTMYKRLIHIEDKKLLLLIRYPCFRQVYQFVLNALLRHHSQVVTDKMKG